MFGGNGMSVLRVLEFGEDWHLEAISEGER